MLDIALLLGCLGAEADPVLMRAIVAHESGGDPYALNVNGDAVVPSGLSPEVAPAAAAEFVAAGYTVDVGLAQVNSRNVTRYGETLERAFEPCTNLALGGRVLGEGLARARRAGHRGDDARRVALSLYNTGSMTRGFTNGYVERVWSRYVADRTIRARTAGSQLVLRDETAGAGESGSTSAGERAGSVASSRLRLRRGSTATRAEPFGADDARTSPGPLEGTGR